MKRIFSLLLGFLLVMPPNMAANATGKAAETSLKQEINLTEPLFLANEGNLWGYIRSDGSWAITPRYIDANDFNEYGIAAVVSPPNEKPLLIDKNANVIYDFSVLSSSGGYFRYGYPATIQHFHTNEEQDMFYNTATRTLITLPEDFFGLARLDPLYISMKAWENNLVLSFYLSALNLSDNSRYAFILLDQNGTRLTDAIYVGYCYVDEPYTLVSLYNDENDEVLPESSTQNTSYMLIDSAGNVVLENLPRGHMEKDVFVASNQDFYCLADGTELTRTEMYARFAAQSPWGVYPYDNQKGESYYVDANGETVAALGNWIIAEPFHEKYGVAWVVSVVYVDSEDECFPVGSVSLLGIDGHIISEDWGPLVSMMDFDFYDGLFPISRDGKYSNYIRPDGSLLYEGFPFQYVANFSNGLASVIFMGNDYALYNAYIAPDGSVVWAEDGQEEWLTQRLDDGIFPRISDITIEDASRMLQGNWKCVSSGDALDDLVFEEDGSYQSTQESAARWKLRENYSEKNSYTLEIWSEENELLYSYGLSFSHSDFMSLRHGEGGTDLARIGSIRDLSF